MQKTYFIINVEPKIQTVVNAISLCSAVITLASILLTGLIAIIDIIKHITIFNTTRPDGSLCIFVAFFGFFIDHMYVFVNVLIAVNMQLIYIHNVLPKPVFETLYLVIATGTAFIIDLIPLGFAAYGKNDIGFCFLKHNIINRYYFKVFLLYATLLPGLVYCLVIFFWVIVSLYRRSNDLQERFPNKLVTIFGESVNGRDFIKKVYFRMGLYPTSCVIGFFPYLLSNMYADIYGSFLGWKYFLFRFCIRLTGVMNLISLLIDPHFQLAIKSILKNGLQNNQTTCNVNLKELSTIKKEDEEYLVKFPGEESIRFEDYIKYL